MHTCTIQQAFAYTHIHTNTYIHTDTYTHIYPHRHTHTHRHIHKLSTHLPRLHCAREGTQGHRASFRGAELKHFGSLGGSLPPDSRTAQPAQPVVGQGDPDYGGGVEMGGSKVQAVLRELQCCHDPSTATGKLKASEGKRLRVM